MQCVQGYPARSLVLVWAQVRGTGPQAKLVQATLLAYRLREASATGSISLVDSVVL